MAVARKPRNKKKIKFELSLGAIGGIAVVLFCLLLWMFLFGVWAGQSLLFPNYGKSTGHASTVLSGENTGKTGTASKETTEKSGAKEKATR